MAIRTQPEDFRVEEDLAPGASLRPARLAAATFAVYALTKRSLTTPEAAVRLARALGVRAGAVVHAGLKDKHALTTQHFSVAGLPAGAPREVGDEAWSARLVGWCGRALESRDILANRFAIVLRDLTHEASDEMDRRARLLSCASDDGQPALAVTNYFGAQRFGSARHGQGFVARALLAGDFARALRLAIATPARKDSGSQREFTRALAQGWPQAEPAGTSTPAPDWPALAHTLPPRPQRRAIEALAAGATFAQAYGALPHTELRLHLDAFQSWLWNRALAALIERTCGTHTLHTSDDYGDMLFAPAQVPAGANPLPTHAPLPVAPDSNARAAEAHAPSPDWQAALEHVLREQGLTLAQLSLPPGTKPTFARATRALHVRASGFALSAPAPCARAQRFTRTLTFALPSASYATVVLRALGQ